MTDYCVGNADFGCDNLIDASSFNNVLEGRENTITSTTGSHIEGYQNVTSLSDFIHVEGEISTILLSSSVHTEGISNVTALGTGTHVEGYQGVMYNTMYSHAEGMSNSMNFYPVLVNGIVTAVADHIEGENNYIFNSEASHVEGISNFINIQISGGSGGTATILGTGGDGNHIEGFSNTVSNSDLNHVEGISNQVVGTGGAQNNHIEGIGITAQHSFNSHAEGCNHLVQGFETHSQGCANTTSNVREGQSISGFAGHFLYNQSLRVGADTYNYSNQFAGGIESTAFPGEGICMVDRTLINGIYPIGTHQSYRNTSDGLSYSIMLKGKCGLKPGTFVTFRTNELCIGDERLITVAKSTADAIGVITKSAGFIANAGQFPATERIQYDDFDYPVIQYNWLCPSTKSTKKEKLEPMICMGGSPCDKRTLSDSDHLESVEHRTPSSDTRKEQLIEEIIKTLSKHNLQPHISPCPATLDTYKARKQNLLFESQVTGSESRVTGSTYKQCESKTCTLTPNPPAPGCVPNFPFRETILLDGVDRTVPYIPYDERNSCNAQFTEQYEYYTVALHGIVTVRLDSKCPPKVKCDVVDGKAVAGNTYWVLKIKSDKLAEIFIP